MEMSVGGFSDFFPATGYYYFIFVFVFHYVRVLENRKIPRVLSTVASVGIDQVAELNEIHSQNHFSFQYSFAAWNLYACH